MRVGRVVVRRGIVLAYRMCGAERWREKKHSDGEEQNHQSQTHWNGSPCGWIIMKNVPGIIPPDWYTV